MPITSLRIPRATSFLRSSSFSRRQRRISAPHLPFHQDVHQYDFVMSTTLVHIDIFNVNVLKWQINFIVCNDDSLPDVRHSWRCLWVIGQSWLMEVAPNSASRYWLTQLDKSHRHYLPTVCHQAIKQNSSRTVAFETLNKIHKEGRYELNYWPWQ